MPRFFHAVGFDYLYSGSVTVPHRDVFVTHTTIILGGSNYALVLTMYLAR